MAETVDQVSAEFWTRYETSVVTMALAQGGLRKMHEQFATSPTFPENPDPAVLVGPGDPSDPATKSIGWIKRSKLLEETAKGGLAHDRLAQQWLVSFYADWEEDLRPRLAKAKGIPTAELRIPALGDIRHMRNDIVHHRGIATAHNTGRCEVLTWFSVGDWIAITHHHLIELREALGGVAVHPTPPT